MFAAPPPAEGEEEIMAMSGWEELTPREREVLELLAAEGERRNGGAFRCVRADHRDARCERAPQGRVQGQA
jgi:hypothetical protein